MIYMEKINKPKPKPKHIDAVQLDIDFKDNKKEVPVAPDEKQEFYTDYDVEVAEENKSIKSFEEERREIAKKYSIMDSSKLKRGDGPSGWDYDFYGDVLLYTEAMKVVDSDDIKYGRK